MYRDVQIFTENVYSRIQVGVDYRNLIKQKTKAHKGSIVSEYHTKQNIMKKIISRIRHIVKYSEITEQDHMT